MNEISSFPRQTNIKIIPLIYDLNKNSYTIEPYSVDELNGNDDNLFEFQYFN